MCPTMATFPCCNMSLVGVFLLINMFFIIMKPSKLYLFKVAWEDPRDLIVFCMAYTSNLFISLWVQKQACKLCWPISWCLGFGIIIPWSQKKTCVNHRIVFNCWKVNSCMSKEAMTKFTPWFDVGSLWETML